MNEVGSTFWPVIPFLCVIIFASGAANFIAEMPIVAMTPASNRHSLRENLTSLRRRALKKAIKAALMRHAQIV
jgi:hypothetical protein